MIVPGLKFKKRRKIFMSDKFVNSRQIISRVCEVFHVTYDELKCKSRVTKFVYARQACMYFLSKNTAMTLTAIGVIFNRDHTTVIHAVQHIQDLMQSDDRVRIELNELKDSL